MSAVEDKHSLSQHRRMSESSEADLSGRFLLRLLRPIAHSKMPTTTATGLQVCHALKY
jgi:hypothetical protein